MTKQIIDNLWQVGGESYTEPGDAAVYLVQMGSSAALIDAGCGLSHSRLVQNIAAVLPDAIPIAYLFLTHCHYDHSGGAQAIKNQFGCTIVAHELDAVYLEAGDSRVTAATWYGSRMDPLIVDHPIRDRQESFTVGNGQLTAMHWPGHTPGSVVYVTRIAELKVLFGQDVHGPLHADFHSDREQYAQSLRLLLSLKADVLCEGHFGVFFGQENIERFIRSFL